MIVPAARVNGRALQADWRDPEPIRSNHPGRPQRAHTTLRWRPIRSAASRTAKACAVCRHRSMAPQQLHMCRDDNHFVVFCFSKSEHAGGLCQALRRGEIAGGQSPVTLRTSKRLRARCSGRDRGISPRAAHRTTSRFTRLVPSYEGCRLPLKLQAPPGLTQLARAQRR
jgi:hypothetical protein